MATTKKSTTNTRKKPTTTRKTTATKSTAARKPKSTAAATTRKTTTKRPAAKRTTTKTQPRRTTAAKSRSAASAKSFRVERSDEPFMSLRLTVQTLYWLILGAAVVGLAFWVLNIHNKVQSIYDEIDQSTLMQQELDARELEMLREQARQQQD